MPNHVENWLTIKGTRDELASVVFAVWSDDREFDYDRIIPYPEEFKQKDAVTKQWENEHPGEWKGKPRNGFNCGGYEWCIENWGTKWNAYDIARTPIVGRDDYATVHIIFESAWSPPIPVIAKLAEMFPKVSLTLTYCEAGTQFAGEYHSGNGGGEDRIIRWQNTYEGTRGG